MSAPKLSVAIPVYNFADYVIETLDSIVDQPGAPEVDVVVVDGASTDATEQIMAAYVKRHPGVRYVRLPNKGGIDFDMHRTVEAAQGDYVWLFSGDDWMRPGALARALEEIKSGRDLYLCQHMERSSQEHRNEHGEDAHWMVWPVIEPAVTGDFNLADPAQRQAYFKSARSSEAFFSFMSGLVVKKDFWLSRPFNQEFNGSCWAHAARFFDLMRTRMDLRFIAEPWLDRRPDNDSFLGRGFIHRIGISIDGYHKIADTYFGHGSREAFEVRRVIRGEFGYGMFIKGKFVSELDPEHESRAQLWRLLRKAYCDWSREALRARWKVFRLPGSIFREWDPAEAQRLEAVAHERKQRAAKN